MQYAQTSTAITPGGALLSKHRLVVTGVSSSVAAAFFLLTCRYVFKNWLRFGFDVPERFLLFKYTYSILVPNYFENGFIRRGLAGTVMAIIDGRSALASGFSFHVLSAALLSVAIAAILFKAMSADWKVGAWLGVVLILSPQFKFWSADIARTDLLSSAFVAFAVVATIYNRWQIASLIIVVGSLAHETVVIMGVPMLVASWYLARREGQAQTATIVAALGTVVGLLVAIALLQMVFPVDPRQVAASVKAAMPPERLRDVGIYMTLGGFRTIAASACMARGYEGYALLVAGGFIFIPFYAMVLGYPATRFHAVLFIFIAILPMLFLTIVAIDYGRWFILAAFNAWLGAALLITRPAGRLPARRYHFLVSLAAFGVLLAGGKSELFFANQATHRLAAQIWDQPMRLPHERLEICDPRWREIVDGNGASAAMHGDLSNGARRSGAGLP